MHALLLRQETLSFIITIVMLWVLYFFLRVSLRLCLASFGKEFFAKGTFSVPFL